MKKIRVFIVDDHPLMRSAIEAAIETSADMEVIGEAVDGQEALTLIPKLRPDVVVMDLMLPILDGWEAIVALKSLDAQIRVLAFSGTTEESKILKAVQLGARGFISKDAHLTDLVNAVRQIAAGNVYLPPPIAGKLFHRLRDSGETATAQARYQSLTPRQKEIISLLGQGLSTQKIAQSLHISPGTLRVHLHNILNKLGLDNRRELLVYAVKRTLNPDIGE